MSPKEKGPLTESEAPEAHRFVASGRFDPAHPPALALYCSDGRFTDAVEELLRRLGHARLDTLTLPGGPALLNLWTAGYSEMDALSRAASFLIKGHHIQRVVLLAHAGCGYYRAHYPSHSAEEMFDLQVNDLRVAARSLLLDHPGLGVDLYYTSLRTSDDGIRVVFDAIPSSPASAP